MQSAVCGSLTFDSQGRIVTVCPSIPFAPQARIIDPDTLEILGDLRAARTPPSPPGTKEYQNFAGGGYFFIDAEDRVWVATRTDHLYVLDRSRATRFTLERDYDLTGVLDTTQERISSALPDFDGNIWFATRRNGKVGMLDPATGGDVEIMQLDEEIQNSFAVTSDGVYIVSEERMYRFKASKIGHGRGSSGRRSTRTPGSSSRARPTPAPGRRRRSSRAATSRSPTTRDPMNVVVYRTEAQARRRASGARSAACRSSSAATSATDNSLIGVGRSLIVENNYGYQDPFGPSSGALTEPGFARVDIKTNGQGLQAGLDQHRGPLAHRGAEDVDRRPG